MKTQRSRNFAFALVALSILGAHLSKCHAQGTAFTYQGRLNDGASPASGIYDLRFAIYDSGTGPTAVAGPLTNSPVAISNGLFTVTLDFGAGAFTGAERWLEIGVRTNGGGAFTTLSLRQQLTATPYAIYAPNAGAATSAASVAANAVGASALQSSAVTSEKIADGTVTAADVNSASFANTFWKMDGNAGTTPGAHFIGTTDNQPLELKAGNLRALRLENNGGDAPNLIAGAPDNAVGATTRGATIAGGTTNLIGTAAHYSLVGGGGNNSVGDDSVSATIAGGWWNTIGTDVQEAVVGGGRYNSTAAARSTIAGGEQNVIDSNGYGAAVGGGLINSIAARASIIAGGEQNVIGTNARHAVVGGGWLNSIMARESTVVGGLKNAIGTNAIGAAVGGGSLNAVGDSAESSVIGGGLENRIANGGRYGTIPGGFKNTATNHAFAAGSFAKAIHTGAFVWADWTWADFASTTNNQFNVRAQGGARFETGGAGMTVDGQAVFTGLDGGGLTTLNASQLTTGTVADGRLSGNVALRNATQTFTGVNSFSQAVGIGTSAPDAPLHVQSGSVGVGLNSRTVLGVERAGDTFIQVLTTTSNYAGVVFGSAYNSLDASVRYNAWGKRDLSFRTDNGTRMIILTNGHVGIANASPTNLLMVSNARCDGSSWINASDRRLKQDFQPADPQAVLEKVVSLPVQQWSYRAQPGQKHLGPVAQDFHAAFGLGADDTSIATVDADGVALAAIQGLNQKLEQKETEITELKARLEALERIIRSQKPN